MATVSLIVRLVAIPFLAALAYLAPASQDCYTTPWLTPCAPIDMSADGVQALAATKAKLQAIAAYRRTPSFAGLRIFLLSATSQPAAGGSAVVKVSALPLSGFLAHSAEVRKVVSNSPAWLAARHELALHWASLTSGGRDSSAEGRIFAQLIEMLTPYSP
jgi:hypothetical protein